MSEAEHGLTRRAKRRLSLAGLRGPIAAAFIFAGLAAAALSFVWLWPEAPAAEAAETAKSSVPVEAENVQVEPLSDRIAAVGSLLSNESVLIRPEIAGRIVEIGIEEGKPVHKGDVLFRLDDSIYAAELAQAEARFGLAQSNFNRVKELFTKTYASGRTRDEAVSEVEVARANVNLARAKLEKTVISAPFGGIAGLRNVSLGDYVAIGKDLVNLEDIDTIKVDFRVAEKFLQAVRPDQTIQIKVDAFPGREFEGTVFAIDPKVDAAGRSVVIRARVPNPDRVLRPGLFARVNLMIELKPKALTVSEQALVPRGDEHFVYRIDDGKVAFKKVQTGTRRNGRVEIVAGLDAGDQVVTAGQLKLREGAAVKVLPAPQTGT